MVNKEEKHNLTTKTNTHIALMTCLFFLVVFVFFSSHLMVIVSSLFHHACTYVCSSCRQRKKKPERNERLVFFSFFFSKNGSIAVAYKKEREIRVCERVVVVVALMTKQQKKSAFRLNTLTNRERYCPFIHFRKIVLYWWWSVSQSVIYFSHCSLRRLFFSYNRNELYTDEKVKCRREREKKKRSDMN
jgi:hypothetical protein